MEKDKYVVEKGIPIPRRDIAKYPFPQMDIGDSFLIPEKERHAARSSAVNYSDVLYGRDRTVPRKKWSIRRFGCGTYRVWRIA